MIKISWLGPDNKRIFRINLFQGGMAKLVLSIYKFYLYISNKYHQNIIKIIF